MLTIRKKLAEQATSGDKAPAPSSSKEVGLSRRPSIRTQLLTAEANELGGAIPSMEMFGRGIGSVYLLCYPV